MNNFMFNFNNTSNNINRQVVSQKSNQIVRNLHIKKHNQNANISNARAWGVLTWMLFHTLAEKVKDEYFTSVINNITGLIKKICICLPCPYCRNDAQNYLSSINFKLIQNKNDLKLFLLDFHNHVNQKLDNEQCSYNILEKYENLDIVKVVTLWSNYFKRYGIEAQEFMEGIQREQVKIEMYNFVIQNRNIFN